MAQITDYSTLKTALLAAFSGNTNVSGNDALLVQLAETKLFRKLNLRTEETETALTGVVSSRFIALPTGFEEPRDLFINITGSGRYPLTFVDEIEDTSTANGRPQFWAIDGTNVAFERPCDQAYSFTLRSLQSLAALSDSNTTNWLILNHPDLYLAACCVEAAKFLPDPDMLALWQPIYDDAVFEVNDQAHRSKAPAPMRVDPALTGAGRGYGYDINRDY